jgi:hypothetical protein
MTVSIDDPAIEEVVNLGDNEGTQKTKLDAGGEVQEEVPDRGSKGVVDVAKGDVKGGRREADAGTKYEGGDTEESGLKLVGGGDKRSMVGAALKSNDSQEVRGVAEELVLRNNV